VRVLLDEQLPRQLAPFLVAHDVRTVQQESWAGLKNGTLLSNAEAAGFAVFVTGDHKRRRWCRSLLSGLRRCPIAGQHSRLPGYPPTLDGYDYCSGRDRAIPPEYPPRRVRRGLRPIPGRGPQTSRRPRSRGADQGSGAPGRAPPSIRPRGRRPLPSRRRGGAGARPGAERAEALLEPRRPFAAARDPRSGARLSSVSEGLAARAAQIPSFFADQSQGKTLSKGLKLDTARQPR